MRGQWLPSIGGMIWVAVWTFPLVEPLGAITTPLSAAGLALFEVLYIFTATLGFDRPGFERLKRVLFGALATLGVALAVAYGQHWLILMLFVSSCAMALYAGEERPVTAVVLFAGALTALIAIGLAQHVGWWVLGGTVIGTVLSSLLVGAVRQMMRLIRQLQHTREALAEAAVVQERLRFSRDLHDLLGHTLSVIVVKAEVVRRLAERDPAAAAAQAADIEDVGRRALVEIREAVTGYREAGLTAELSRAKGALSSAGIAAEVLRTAAPVPDDADHLLAWVVREATTNIVRHSRATRCEISLSTTDGAVRLHVEDDGEFTPAAAPVHGNGLRGLTERLHAAGGSLETGPRPGGGFSLTAKVPL